MGMNKITCVQIIQESILVAYLEDKNLRKKDTVLWIGKKN